MLPHEPGFAPGFVRRGGDRPRSRGAPATTAASR
jgi:hypothetical protein